MCTPWRREMASSIIRRGSPHSHTLTNFEIWGACLSARRWLPGSCYIYAAASRLFYVNTSRSLLRCRPRGLFAKPAAAATISSPCPLNILQTACPPSLLHSQTTIYTINFKYVTFHPGRNPLYIFLRKASFLFIFRNPGRVGRQILCLYF